MKNKFSYVEKYKYLPIYRTGIILNTTDNGEYDEIIIGLILDGDEDFWFNLILKSYKDNYEEDKIILEGDWLPDYVYNQLLIYVSNKIAEFNRFKNLTREFVRLYDWINSQRFKKEQLKLNGIQFKEDEI